MWVLRIELRFPDLQILNPVITDEMETSGQPIYSFRISRNHILYFPEQKATKSVTEHILGLGVQLTFLATQ